MQTPGKPGHCEHAGKRQTLVSCGETISLLARNAQEQDHSQRKWATTPRRKPRKYSPGPSQLAQVSLSAAQLPAPSPMLSSFLSSPDTSNESQKGEQSEREKKTTTAAQSRSMWSLGSDIPAAQYADSDIQSKLATSDGISDTDNDSSAGANVTDSTAQDALAYHPNITVTPYISSSSSVMVDEIVPCSLTDAISFADHVIPTIAAHWDLEDFRRMAVAPVRLSGRATVLIMGPTRAQNRAKLHAFATLVRDVLQDMGLLWKWEVVVCEAEILVRQC